MDRILALAGDGQRKLAVLGTCETKRNRVFSTIFHLHKSTEPWVRLSSIKTIISGMLLKNSTRRACVTFPRGNGALKRVISDCESWVEHPDPLQMEICDQKRVFQQHQWVFGRNRPRPFIRFQRGDR